MIQDLLKKQDDYFHSNQTRSYDFRIKMLDKLKRAIQAYEGDLLAALKSDLNKPEFEAYTNEIGFVLDSISHTKKHLKSWMKKKRVKTPIHQFGAKSYIEYVPYGRVLIIGPFNYPFQLLIEPLVGAIASGNTAVLKPSEYTKATERVLVDMIEKTFDPAYVSIVTGEVEVTQELLAADFDYIFFTGSVPVGKIVMEAAAKRLTPVTLELGGKSPVIVDETAQLDLAAKRIAWGKFLNAGQTCVAPDYVYVHESVHDQLVEKIRTHVLSFYGDQAHTSPDYGRIVSERHFNRLRQLIHKDKVYHGGSCDHKELYIQPTIMTQVEWTDQVMSDEIFGPLLPILTYKDLDQVIDLIRRRDKPLALYVFSESKTNQDKILSQVSFGGGGINDTISHVASPYLPFGGVQTSGFGAYHGQHSFEAFSHRRSMIKKSTKIDLKLVFPPYGEKIKLARKFMK